MDHEPEVGGRRSTDLPVDVECGAVVDGEGGIRCRRVVVEVGGGGRGRDVVVAAAGPVESAVPGVGGDVVAARGLGADVAEFD